jgi:LuxR family maltose regulon positive regulatory protein
MRLLGLVPDLAPWRLVAGRVLLARASILMGDPTAANGLLDDAREPLALLGDAPAMLEDVALARESAGSWRSARAPGRHPHARRDPRAALPADPSLVPRDRGALHISRFTVRSQALAICRKLAVSGRGAAVARARVLGLLDDEPPG